MGLSFVILFIYLFQFTNCQKRWEPLATIQATSIFRIIPMSTTDVFLAGFDDKKGSIIYHSGDEGITWNQIESQTGTNLDFSVSKDGHFLCGIGSKIFCLELDETKNHQKSAHELNVEADTSDIDAVEESGFALTGQFHTSKNRPMEVVNGVAYISQLDTSYWEFCDIGLKVEDGYVARKASFPTSKTWYVVSGSWPKNNPQANIILTGKLSIVPGKEMLTYNFDLQGLDSAATGPYVGAISKTSDGGKTFLKVFDSNNEFYFNEIDCINDRNCVTVGEGSKGSVIMVTNDGGDTWEQVMRLSNSYSLHGVKMITMEEIWVCGGMAMQDSNKGNEKKGNVRRRVSQKDDGKKFIGLFYHSVNGGKSWNLQTVDGYIYSMSFFPLSSSIGYAATLHREFSTVSVVARE